jgi:hypothetical protein
MVSPLKSDGSVHKSGIEVARRPIICLRVIVLFISIMGVNSAH